MRAIYPVNQGASPHHETRVLASSTTALSRSFPRPASRRLPNRRNLRNFPYLAPVSGSLRSLLLSVEITWNPCDVSTCYCEYFRYQRALADGVPNQSQNAGKCPKNSKNSKSLKGLKGLKGLKSLHQRGSKLFTSGFHHPQERGRPIGRPLLDLLAE
jgi:hypothetical protein